MTNRLNEGVQLTKDRECANRFVSPEGFTPTECAQFCAHYRTLLSATGRQFCSRFVFDPTVTVTRMVVGVVLAEYCTGSPAIQTPLKSKLEATGLGGL